MRSSCAVFTTRESSGRRRRESRITRSSGRRRGRPVRSVSSGSSAMIVPTPTMMASLAWRIWCTCARAASLVIQPPLAASEPRLARRHRLRGGGAILPSSVIAVFSVTNGVLWRMYFAKASFSLRASASQRPFVHFDAAAAQLGEAAAADQRIGIAHGSDDALHAGRDDRVGAGTGASNVRAGFQVQIERGAARTLAGLFQRQHLGVLQAVVSVEAAADDLARRGRPAPRRRTGWARPARCLSRGQLPALAA